MPAPWLVSSKFSDPSSIIFDSLNYLTSAHNKNVPKICKLHLTFFTDKHVRRFNVLKFSVCVKLLRLHIVNDSSLLCI